MRYPYHDPYTRAATASDIVDDEYGDALRYGLILALVWERLGGFNHPNESDIWDRLAAKFEARYPMLCLDDFAPYRSGETARTKTHDLRAYLIEKQEERHDR
jgi:hypothetical protein